MKNVQETQEIQETEIETKKLLEIRNEQETQETQETEKLLEIRNEQETQETQETEKLLEIRNEQETQETQETEIETKKLLEIRNVQEIEGDFYSLEVKNLYCDDFCQYIFDPKTKQNEELLELLKTADIKRYVIDIEALKTAKHAELKAIMQAKRNALTCEYADDVFDCNEQAQSNMTSLMVFANLGMKEFSIRSTTEHTHTFTAEQLVELATIMSKTLNDLYCLYWSYKNALYECKTKEEIENIKWEI